jgi:hypothetical protein
MLPPHDQSIMFEKLHQTGGNSLGIVPLNAAVTEDQDIHAPTTLPGSPSSQ